MLSGDFLMLGLILILLLVLGGILAFERAILRSSPTMVKEMAKNENKKNLFNFLLFEDFRVISLIGLWKSLVSGGLFAIMVFLALQLGIKTGGLILLLLGLLCLLLLMQIVIWNWVKHKPEQVLLELYPLAWLAAWVLNLRSRFNLGEEKSLELREGEDNHHFQSSMTEEDIKMLVEAGQEHGVLEEDETEMIHSIFEFNDTMAKEVMVPRVDMIMMEAEFTISQALDIGIKHGYSRYPVYEENVDSIIGILHLKDLLSAVKAKKMEEPVSNYLRQAHFTPGIKKTDELLKEMQEKKISTVVVLDEYGGTDGFITIEDLVEEIVGELIDEQDKETPVLEIQGDGSWLVDARMDIDDFSSAVEIKVPFGDYETVGGYIYSLFARVPKEKEELRLDELGLRVVVENLQGHRIKKLRFYLLPAPNVEAGSNGQ